METALSLVVLQKKFRNQQKPKKNIFDFFFGNLSELFEHFQIFEILSEHTPLASTTLSNEKERKLCACCGHQYDSLSRDNIRTSQIVTMLPTDQFHPKTSGQSAMSDRKPLRTQTAHMKCFKFSLAGVLLSVRPQIIECPNSNVQEGST
jgi:hypothetical protein